MYETHFGFRQPPFSLTPDPRFLYLSEHHREALAHLLYGVGEGGGFVQLTGEVGTGKTTLCRSVLEQAPDGVDLALVFNPRLTPAELVATVCDELDAPYPESAFSIKTLVDALFDRLLEIHAQGHRAVVVIDEAQNLDAAALEQIRLLTNLETPTQKLLQIVLIGQPELQELMSRPDLRQIAQRVTARYHLPPLTATETSAYIGHRLLVAGGDPGLFTPAAVRLVHRISGGVPRLINIFCDRALLGGYAREVKRVGAGLMRQAAREVRGDGHRPTPGIRLAWSSVLLVAVVVIATLGALSSDLWSTPETKEPVAAEPPPVSQPTPTTADAPPKEPARTESETPAAPELTSLDLLNQLRALGPDADDGALRQLLAIWGVSASGAAIQACDVAADAGLRCYRSRGNLTEVLRLDRPTILDLEIQPGETRPLLLGGVENGRLVWSRETEVVVLPPQIIEPLWHGSFTLIWQPPPGASLILGLGSEGLDVAWLTERLAALEPQPGPVVMQFDADVEQRVQTIQQVLGLAPDGIAGRETIMRLNSATNPAIPRLAAN